MTVLKEGIVGGALNLYFIYKFMRILTTPFASTDAFKLGIIDEKGKILKKHKKLKTIEEKEAYTMMHRLVWKLKRLMEKVPFGKSRLASYAAALWLIKEENNFEGTDQELQESFLSFLETDWKEEALILKENYEGDMDKKSFSNFKNEGIDIAKASMKDVIKDFQSSDAPQFKGKSDKKKKEMAVAAKLSKEEVAPHAKVMAKKGDSAEEIKKMHPEITDDELEKLFKEEVGIDEVLVMGKAPKTMKDNEKLKWFDKLKSGDTISLWYDSSMAKGTNWREFKVGRKSKSKKFNLEKISMQMMKDGKAGGVKWFLYNRQGNISMAWGDMGVSLISMKEELEEARRMPKNVRDYMKFAKGQGPNPDQVLDVKDVDKWVKEIKKGIKAGWVSVGSSSLGGDENVAIMIKLTLEKENDWPHKILHNASFGMIRIDVDGGMEMFASGHKVKNMRKTSVKSARDVVSKINTWIKKVDEEVLEDGTDKMANRYREDTPGQIEEAMKSKVADAGMECQECGKKFRAKLSTLEYGKTKCPKCKSTDIDFAFGESIEEKKSATGYELYHKDFSSAMQHAYDHAKKKGFVIDPKEIDDKVATGPKKPSSGKVNRYSLKAGRKRVEIQVTNLDNKRYELNMYIEGKEELSTFSKFITEGRPALDPDYVPPRTQTDAMRAKYVSTQKKLYSANDIESMARKYKVKLDGPPVGGKAWGGDWEIVLKNGVSLSYEYGPNSTYIKGWKFDRKAIKNHISKYANEHETPRDYAPMGGKVLVGGFETAFELISEEVELNEIAPWKKGNYTVKDQDGKVLGRFKSGAKAQKFVDKIWDEGDYDSLTVELGEEVVYTRRVELDEAAPVNSVAGGNVNLDPFKKKRKNAKVQTEIFGGQKVFVVTPERFYDSRLGKSRYARYEKYVGNDKLGETIRQYGRTNPKAPIILKNSGNGAMLYLKYGRN